MKNIKRYIAVLAILSCTAGYGQPLKRLKFEFARENPNLQACLVTCTKKVEMLEDEGTIPKLKDSFGKLSPYKNMCYRQCYCHSKIILARRSFLKKNCSKIVVSINKDRCIWWNPARWVSCVKWWFE